MTLLQQAKLLSDKVIKQKELRVHEETRLLNLDEFISMVDDKIIKESSNGHKSISLAPYGELKRLDRQSDVQRLFDNYIDQGFVITYHESEDEVMGEHVIYKHYRIS